ncbi:MAG: UDP-3-O-acyl-N-acetylglucosamine deacetylase, partial [Chlamydiota bacterium]
MTGSDTADMQKTIQRESTTAGIGLFTGEKVFLKLCPAPVGSGIVFVRSDLQGNPEIPARLEFVRQVPRCTRLANGQASIHMVEHILSALSALKIDNVRIEVEGPEIPAGDGSSNVFVELIEKAGIVSQNAPRRKIRIREPLFWSEGEIHLIALPSP